MAFRAWKNHQQGTVKNMVERVKDLKWVNSDDYEKTSFYN